MTISEISNDMPAADIHLRLPETIDANGIRDRKKELVEAVSAWKERTGTRPVVSIEDEPHLLLVPVDGSECYVVIDVRYRQKTITSSIEVCLIDAWDVDALNDSILPQGRSIDAEKKILLAIADRIGIFGEPKTMQTIRDITIGEMLEPQELSEMAEREDMTVEEMAGETAGRIEIVSNDGLNLVLQNFDWGNGNGHTVLSLVDDAEMAMLTQPGNYIADTSIVLKGETALKNVVARFEQRVTSMIALVERNLSEGASRRKETIRMLTELSMA